MRFMVLACVVLAACGETTFVQLDPENGSAADDPGGAGSNGNTNDVNANTNTSGDDGNANANANDNANANANENTNDNGSSSDAAPVLDAISDRVVSEGQTLSFTVSATDPEGDAFTLSSDGTVGPGMDPYSAAVPASFDAASGLFTWSPTATELGLYSLQFAAVSDGDPTFRDEETLTIEVVAAPPTVTFATLIASGGVFGSNCVQCHSGNTTRGSFDITDFAQVSSVLVGGDPDASVLFQRMNDDVDPMPPAGILPNAELSIVRQWIDAGAPEN